MNVNQTNAIRQFFAAIRMAGGDVTFTKVTCNATSMNDVAVAVCTSRHVYALLVDVDGNPFINTGEYVLIEDIQDAEVL